MSIIYHERPGVYTQYDASAVYATKTGVKTVALVAASSASAGLYTLRSYAEGEAVFGAQSQMAKLLKLLFLNGASKVLACPAATDTAGAYEQALSLIFAQKEAAICVIGSCALTVQLTLKAALESAAENRAECIGIVGLETGLDEDYLERAAALNSKRMVLVTPSVYITGSTDCYDSCAAAAALAGVLSAQTDPALPLNGAVLHGLEGVETVFTETQLDSLILGGVTPVECVGGEVSVIRAVTTHLTADGVADSTWRELNTILIADDVIPGIRSALQKQFSRTKNNAATRKAIRNQVVVELESRIKREIIDSYDELTVEASDTDPTVCQVSFTFAVTHGLNRIHLQVHITI